MNISHSDALVFFGATGDLAYKKIAGSFIFNHKRPGNKLSRVNIAKLGIV